MDFRMFLMQPWAWSCLMMGGTLFTNPWGSGNWQRWEKKLPLENEAKICWGLLHVAGHYLYKAGYIFSFPDSILVKVLFLVCIPCQIQLHLCLWFPYLISTHLDGIPIFFSRDIFLVPAPVHFILTLSLGQKALTEPLWPHVIHVQFFTHMNQDLFHSKLFKELSFLFISFVPEGSFLETPIHQFLK